MPCKREQPLFKSSKESLGSECHFETITKAHSARNKLNGVSSSWAEIWRWHCIFTRAHSHRPRRFYNWNKAAGFYSLGPLFWSNPPAGFNGTWKCCCDWANFIVAQTRARVCVCLSVCVCYVYLREGKSGYSSIGLLWNGNGERATRPSSSAKFTDDEKESHSIYTGSEECWGVKTNSLEAPRMFMDQNWLTL